MFSSNKEFNNLVLKDGTVLEKMLEALQLTYQKYPTLKCVQINQPNVEVTIFNLVHANASKADLCFNKRRAADYNLYQLIAVTLMKIDKEMGLKVARIIV